ncbi:hypothetical protein ACIQNU_32955 [Streptomyces sp. NPDC091292]|uniref:hypothetical protein n=1 Tax=Streptomyces sp. NPDC091292 TaxID=3365991 RepID=UPI0037FF0F83
MPDRFGCRVDPGGTIGTRTITAPAATLSALFPAAVDVPVAHTWWSVLAVPRAWCPTVRLGPSTGIGWAGGYVGQGVSASHLAARTLTGLVLGEETEGT